MMNAGKDVAIVIFPGAEDFLREIERSLRQHLPPTTCYYMSFTSGEPLPEAKVYLLLCIKAEDLLLSPFVDRLKFKRPHTRHVLACASESNEKVWDSIERHLVSGHIDDFLVYPFCHTELRTRLLRWTATEEDLVTSYDTNQRTERCVWQGLIGKSPSFQHEMSLVKQIAACDAGVLLLGETGTGKEVCAQAIHYTSSRMDGPWVTVNCGAIPAELIENELFGHTRGAYTHANCAREGLISEAEGGTLFLDEIDNMPLSGQGKLLRFLEDRVYRPIGTNTLRKANVRIIAASNQSLQLLIKNGDFRQDLFFRLNILSLTLSPLRQRIEDIPLLAQYFADRLAQKTDRAPRRISEQALLVLAQYDWPGNVRELKHMIERAILLSNATEIRSCDLCLPYTVDNDESCSESFQKAKARYVKNFEQSYLQRLMLSCDGNISLAARIAKKNRRALFELLKKHDIKAQHYRH